jgi:hypothetical protein
MSEVKKIPKQEVFSEWNFKVSTYDFTIPNGSRAWETLNLVELKTTKKRWSDESWAYYNQDHYISISHEQFVNFLKSLNSKVNA